MFSVMIVFVRDSVQKPPSPVAAAVARMLPLIIPVTVISDACDCLNNPCFY